MLGYFRIYIKVYRKGKNKKRVNEAASHSAMFLGLAHLESVAADIVIGIVVSHT